MSGEDSGERDTVNIVDRITREKKKRKKRRVNKSENPGQPVVQG